MIEDRIKKISIEETDYGTVKVNKSVEENEFGDDEVPKYHIGKYKKSGEN